MKQKLGRKAVLQKEGNAHSVLLGLIQAAPIIVTLRGHCGLGPHHHFLHIPKIIIQSRAPRNINFMNPTTSKSRIYPEIRILWSIVDSRRSMTGLY
jgi:hypothetical protein